GVQGDDLGPAADAVGLHSAVVAARRYADPDEGDLRVEPACGESLVAALAVADQGEGFTVPHGAAREEVEGALEPDEHPAEVDRLAAGVAVGAVGLQVAGGNAFVEILRLSVGQSVGVDVHGEEAVTRPPEGGGQAGAAHSGSVDPE